MIRILKIVVLMITFLICKNIFSQNQTEVKLNEKECFDNFPDGIYKDEIAIFTIKGNNPQNIEKTDYFESAIVRSVKNGNAELIPLMHSYCYHPLSIVIEGNEYTSSIRSIFFTFKKYYCWIPDSAIYDIINPTFSTYIILDKEIVKHYCNTHHIKRLFGRYKPIQIIDNWNVYIPADAPVRLYIHMVNYKYRYEVTWIIDKEKYIGRVIDNID